MSSNGVRILEGDERKVGIPLASAPAAQIASVGSSVRWLDWRQLTIRTLRPAILPAAPAPSIGVPLALQMSIPVDQLPAKVTYRWDFGDRTPKASVANNTGVQHTYDAAGTYTIIGEIIDDRNAQVIGKATTTATIAGGIKWRLDQFAITARTCPGACSEVSFAEFERLAVTPGSGVLYAYPTAVTPSLGANYPTPGIYLAVAPRGVTTPPVPWAPATNVTWPLGNTFVGQSAGGFPISNSFAWTGGNSSGTIVGAASPLDQVSNDFRFTIDATKAGNTISGTMTMVQRTRPSLAVVFAYTATFRGQVLP